MRLFREPHHLFGSSERLIEIRHQRYGNGPQVPQNKKAFVTCQILVQTKVGFSGQAC